ncbi:unnamed protein product [Protopolystoma xenopodis]|uniref:Uncharacterized protein n=1 Tax=Protopolystoma xenopodis TaxID=117903 RepID=A0A448WXB5_9PLAT|nr:unnamed protein product [Protopolystoma xenopodis]
MTPLALAPISETTDKVGFVRRSCLVRSFESDHNITQIQKSSEPSQQQAESRTIVKQTRKPRMIASDSLLSGSEGANKRDFFFPESDIRLIGLPLLKSPEVSVI